MWWLVPIIFRTLRQEDCQVQSQPSPLPDELVSSSGLLVQCVPRLHIHAGLRGTWISLCFELSLLIHHPETHLQSRMGFIEPFS